MAAQRIRWIGAGLILLHMMASANAEEASVPDSLKVDLDEVVAAGGVEPVNGMTSSGQPNKEALQVFADSGYAAVIDLRGKNENRGFDERATVEALGMTYFSLPIDSPQAMNFDNARKLNEILETADGPVLLHCGSGNRVGALLALRKSLDGATDEEAIAHGRDAGLTRAEGIVRQRLEERAVEP